MLQNVMFRIGFSDAIFFCLQLSLSFFFSELSTYANAASTTQPTTNTPIYIKCSARILFNHLNQAQNGFIWLETERAVPGKKTAHNKKDANYEYIVKRA